MEPTTYQNTDLELAAPCDLSPLSAAFEAQGMFTLHCELRDDGLWSAWFESSGDHSNPESTISCLLTNIESLDRRSQQIWSQCTHREFNIGYHCGLEPWAFNQGLSTQTVARVAGVGASLRITLYPPTLPAT